MNTDSVDKDAPSPIDLNGKSRRRRGFGKPWNQLRHGDLTRDSTFATGVELLVVTVSLISFYLLARSIGKSSYGEFGAVYAVVAPLVTLIAVGPSLAALQGGLRLGSDRTSAVGQALGAHLMMFVPAVLVATAVLVPATTFPVLPLLALIVAELGGSGLLSVVGVSLQLSVGIRGKLAVQAMAALGRLSLIVGLASIGHLRVQTYFLGLCFMNFCCLGVGAWSLRRHSRQMRPLRPKGIFLRTSIGLAVSLFFLGLQSDFDKFLLVAFGRAEEAGGYTAAYRIVSIAIVPVAALIGTTQHRLMNAPDRRGVISLVLRYSKLAGAYSVCATMGIAIVAPFVDDLLGKEYSDVPRNMLLLCPMVIARSLNAFPLNGLLAFDVIWHRTMLIISTALISIVLYLLLIPTNGVVGAAIATTITELLMSTGAWLLLLHHYRRHEPKHRHRRKDTSD